MEPISRFDGEFSFLSNFYPCEIEFEGLVYPTIEHAYQASKTLDHEERMNVLKLQTPGKAKRAGKKLTLRSDWENVKLSIMEELVNKKFQARELQELLVSTGARPIIEGNNWGDTFWGTCKGAGQNHLGRILMKIRESLHQPQ